MNHEDVEDSPTTVICPTCFALVGRPCIGMPAPNSIDKPRIRLLQTNHHDRYWLWRRCRRKSGLYRDTINVYHLSRFRKDPEIYWRYLGNKDSPETWERRVRGAE
jgi:hypothetical protein